MTEEKESPFRFLNSIMNGDRIVFDDDQEKEYKKVAFLTNRGLSQHADAIMYVNEINQLPHLTPKMQYDYLYRSIRKMKRPFRKWAKGPDLKDIKLIQRAYGYNEKRAKEILRYWPNIGLTLVEIYGDKND